MGRSAPPGTGLLLILSGPSGSGKSTLIQRLRATGEFPIVFSVSATSRAPRPGEVDGTDYHFCSRDEFLALEREGKLLEYAQVHDHLYGTPRQGVEEAIERGDWILLEIDVQGHQQVKQMMPNSVSFFVRTPDLATYEKRLRLRATESEEEIERRLESVRRELAQAGEYDFQIVNEEVEQAVRTWRTLLWGIRALRSPGSTA